MKKNISINLQGIIFHIEDDGYEALSRYLHEVKAHFASYQGHEEIVADIEGRIAELFAARLSVSKQVITLADVQELTAKMGRVSDFAPEPDEEEAAYAEPAAAGAGRNPSGGPALPGTPPTADGQPRRLYRDLAHRKIAGVCAGIAQYFLINPLLVRLAFLALVLLPNLFRHRFPFPGVGMFDREFDLSGFAVIAYVILWIVLPKRDDAPEPIDTLSGTGPWAGRKLFRDTDTGKVGGVAAGLAAYFQTDVVLVRVLLLLGLFLGGSTFIIYLILWAVVPEARTVSEKIQMRGDDVTLSGIDNSLRTNAFDTENPTAPNRPVGTFLESAARNARPAVSFIGTLLRWAVAALLIFLGGSALFSILSVLAVALSVIPATAVVHTDNSFMFNDGGFGSVVRNVPAWGAVAMAVVAGIPALMLMFLGLRLILRRPVLGRTGSLSLLGLWLLGLVGATTAGVQIAANYRTRATYSTTQRLLPVAGPSIVLASRNLEDHFTNVRLHFAVADSGAAPFIEKEYQARGRTADAARLTAQQSIVYNVSQQDSTITFDQGFQLREDAPFRNQRLNLMVHLPLNKTYRLTPFFIKHLDNKDFTTNHQPNDNQAHRARFTSEGKFECLDCPATSDGGDDNNDNQDSNRDEVVELGLNGSKMQVRVNTDGDNPTVTIHTDAAKFSTDPATYGTGRKNLTNPDNFSEVEVHGALHLVVRQGDSYKVEAAGRTEDLSNLRLNTSGDRLVITQRGNSWLAGGNFGSHPLLVTVTLPQLDHLKVSGACQSDVSGFRDADLHLEASGASTTRLDVSVPRLELDLSGACSAELRGKADDLSIDGAGVCQVNALALQAQRTTIDLAGMSQAKVRTSEELKVDLSGSSTVRYAGRPSRIEKDLSGSSSLEEVKE